MSPRCLPASGAAARAGGPLLALLAPPACGACRRPLAAGLVCGDCLRRLPWLRGHRCPRCGLPRHRAGCPAATAAFDRAWAPLAYEGTARDIVRALKFHAALPLAGLMAAHMAANLPADLRQPPRGEAAAAGPPPGDGALASPPRGEAAAAGPPPGDGALASPPRGEAAVAGPPPGDGALASPPRGEAAVANPPPLAVVPVPPHKGRLRRRGFDPAALLAAGLAARAGLPLVACLRRTDRGRRQVGAGRSLRRSAGRFAAVAVSASPRRVVLVDDVHTTGATLEVCARALKESGSEWVGAATYVRTL